MSIGAIYTVVGRKHLEEACCSACSLRKAMPGIPITLFTGLKDTHGCFDDVVLLENPANGIGDKIGCMGNSPYDYTLYLDADTYVCADVAELFDLLQSCDMALAHAFNRVVYPIDGIPDSFTGFNSGVMVYRRNPRTKRFFADWARAYAELAERHNLAHRNEPSLRLVLYHSDLKLGVLSMEYNCRLHQMGHLQGQAKILHAHVSLSQWSAIADAVNQTLEDRIFVKGRVYANGGDGPVLLADFASSMQDLN